MKNIIIIISLLVVFTLASCRSVISTPNFTERAPDTLSKSTDTLLAKDSGAELPRGTFVQTEPTKKTTVATTHLMEVEVVAHPDVSEPIIIVLLPNTEIILPESTTLVTTDQSTPVTVLGLSKVTLPPGTEITVTKINYYAILFYILLVCVVLWMYTKNKDQDTNNDGLVDEKPIEITPSND